jgi:AhpD family alkylhydroperoxidase
MIDRRHRFLTADTQRGGASMARISYVEAEGAPEIVADEYKRLAGERGLVGTIYQGFAHSPVVMPKIIALGEALRGQAKLDRKTQELTILRTAQQTQSAYEWSHHLVSGRRVGVSEEQLAGVADWKNSPHFDDRQRAAFRCADEITSNIQLSEDGFKELRENYDEQETTEVILTVSYYNFIARWLRSADIDLESDFVEAGATMPSAQG